MASKSSKSLPFLVLAIAFALAIYEAETGKTIAIDLLVPILAPIGVAGAAKSAIEKVAQAKQTAKDIVKAHAST
jgi:hypothetical protein